MIRRPEATRPRRAHLGALGQAMALVMTRAMAIARRRGVDRLPWRPSAISLARAILTAGDARAETREGWCPCSAHGVKARKSATKEEWKLHGAHEVREKKILIEVHPSRACHIA